VTCSPTGRATSSSPSTLLLGAGAAGALAGCVGGGSDADSGGGETTDGSGSGGEPGGDETGGDSSGTSPADGCASAFGDTDEPYEPGPDSGWIATFAVPMGGEVFYEDSTSTGSVGSFGYIETELEGNYEQQVGVSQRGPYEDADPDQGAVAIAERDRYEDGGSVTYDGSERTVAVVRTDDASVIWLVGVQGPDAETYQLQAQASVASGDPCPDTYEAVCERVMASFEPR
jgi:hypothetical protein